MAATSGARAGKRKRGRERRGKKGGERDGRGPYPLTRAAARITVAGSTTTVRTQSKWDEEDKNIL
jgi:hypothetical protein